MLIENKYVVHETRDDAYFTGMNDENRPVLERLNSRVRTYDSKRAANCAIKRIEESGIEYCEFIAEYIQSEIVPDVPPNEPANVEPQPPKEPPIISDTNDWETLDNFGSKIRYLRKQSLLGYIFAVLCADGKMRGFSTDEMWAWTWYSDYRRDFGSGLIERRLGNPTNPERGNAE
ncbi:MAG: hypothetical protein HDS66_08565 [Bacteroidales bacterium]|nr:hypothetical protein [Bacteroidales bacterium]